MVAVTKFSEIKVLLGGFGWDRRAEGQVSVLRNSRLSSPGNLPNNCLEGRGDSLPGQLRRACHARIDQVPVCVLVI